MARKKFIARFVLRLLKSRNIRFYEVAQHPNDDAKMASNETHIQAFFREVDLNYLASDALLGKIMRTDCLPCKATKQKRQHYEVAAIGKRVHAVQHPGEAPTQP